VAKFGGFEDANKAASKGYRFSQWVHPSPSLSPPSSPPPHHFLSPSPCFILFDLLLCLFLPDPLIIQAFSVACEYGNLEVVEWILTFRPLVVFFNADTMMRSFSDLTRAPKEQR